MQLRIAGIVDDSVVDGDGVRLTIFTQGCPHHCHGCHNAKTWPLDGGCLIDPQEILERVDANPILSGITFSGGEPFLHATVLTEIAKEVHKMGKDVWCYTGFTYEELEKLRTSAPPIGLLLDEVDVLVDGPYVEAQRDLTLHFRGSRNQRVIDMQKTRETGSITLRYTD